MAAGLRGPKRLTEVVKVIDLARANNVSIMLTQFAAYKGGALEVRHAVLTGSKLGLERLSLLLQVCTCVLLLSDHGNLCKPLIMEPSQAPHARHDWLLFLRQTMGGTRCVPGAPGIHMLCMHWLQWTQRMVM